MLKNPNEPGIKSTPFIGFGHVPFWLYRAISGNHGQYLPAPGIWLHDGLTKRNTLWVEESARDALLKQASFLLGASYFTQYPEYPALSGTLSSLFNKLSPKDAVYLGLRQRGASSNQPNAIVRSSLMDEIEQQKSTKIQNKDYLLVAPQLICTTAQIRRGLRWALLKRFSTISKREALVENDNFLTATLLSNTDWTDITPGQTTGTVLNITPTRIFAETVPGTRFGF